MSNNNEITIRDADKQPTDKEYREILSKWLGGDYEIWLGPNNITTIGNPDDEQRESE